MKEEFPKIRCKRTFKESGADAAIALARELDIAESRLQRWIKEWSNGAVEVPRNREPRTDKQVKKRPASADLNKRRVEIFPSKKKNGKQRWYGVVLEAGPEQSVVYIYEGPESMVGKAMTYMNKDFADLPKQDKLNIKRVERVET